MNNLLTTKNLKLPEQLASQIFQKTREESVIAALSKQDPQKFGDVAYMNFTHKPRAEYVGEGAEKNPAEYQMKPVLARPHKVQVTMRFTDEVMWADEDYQMDILSTLADAGAESLARALDLGLIHGISPLSGEKASTIDDHITKTTNTVVAAGQPEKEIETASGLLIADNYRPSGVALTTSYAWDLAQERYADGKKKFPELALNATMTNFGGVPCAVSSTVGGLEAKQATNVLGIVGDWNALRWGVQRYIPVQLIQSGDPDGLGDLSRNNQVALRLEAVYGWAILDYDAFAVIKKS